MPLTLGVQAGQQLKALSCQKRSRSYSRLPASAAMKTTVHLLRHGQTEMNVYLEQHEDDFEDPLFYDTKLTDKGQQEAREAAEKAAALQPQPHILISSPLSRALQTTDITFKDFKGQRLAHSLARERTYFASDVGVARAELEGQWPHWSFKGVSEEVWWLDHTEDKGDPKKVIPESSDQFQQRMKKLKSYLAEREEPCVALIVHRDVIESLAGKSPANCEFLTIQV